MAIGLPHEIAHGSLRLTLGEQNTEEDVDYVIETVTDVVKTLRSMSRSGRTASRICRLLLT